MSSYYTANDYETSSDVYRWGWDSNLPRFQDSFIIAQLWDFGGYISISDGPPLACGKGGWKGKRNGKGGRRDGTGVGIMENLLKRSMEVEVGLST